jgi:hypothetical protein
MLRLSSLLSPVFGYQPSCPTSLMRLLLWRTSPRSYEFLRVRYYWDSDSCQRSPRRQVSPLAARHFPIVPSSTTWYAAASLYPPRQRAALIPGFATLVQARRHTPPKQVRHPTDRQFASGYSPPRLTTTQLPSATELWPTPTGTCTLQVARPRGRTLNRLRGGWTDLPFGSVSNM